MAKRKLRIGLLLDAAGLPAWAHRLACIIRQSDYADIALVARLRPPPAERGPASPIRRALAAMERALVGKPGLLPDASALVDGTEVLAGIAALPLADAGGQHGEGIRDAELARIQASGLDVLVHLGRAPLPDGICRGARYGVWAYQHGDPRPNPGSRPGYWEVMRSSPTIESTLCMLTPDADACRVLYHSHSSTHDMSLADNLSNALWKALHFVPRKLKELHEEGEEEFLARVAREDTPRRSLAASTAAPPGDGELARLLWRKFLQKLRRKLDDRRYFWQWFLLYDIGAEPSTSVRTFKSLMPPKDRFWADPFVIARDGKYYVFIEELPYARGKGHISVIVMDKDGGVSEPMRVLEAPYHLSFPFLFEFDGTLYMIPESGANRTVDVYRCVSFPTSWEHHRTLMRGCRAVDATLLQHSGKWWMFVNQAETDGASTWDELHLYYSDSPFADRWIAHPRNPVVSDARSARPAGRLFVRDGRLFRPSQDCSGHYGRAFNICEVTQLTPLEYRERVVQRVAADWDQNIVSTHTFNHAGGLTVVDAQLRRRR